MNDKKDKYELLKIENQLCFPLYAASRKIVNLYSPRLKPLGLTYTQYIVFLVLWEYAPIAVGELGKKLYLDNGTLTPLLKKLESDGYVMRSRSSEDERVVIISLTDKGMELKDKAVDVPVSMASCLTLNNESAKSLYDILYSILNENAE